MSEHQTAHWRQVHSMFQADSAAVAAYRELSQQRQHVQQEMNDLLDAFLEKGLSLHEFNAIFQQKTHGAWNVFHVKGMSGGMFLNKLIKYLPNKDQLGQLLRVTLRLPGEERDARWWMKAFVRYLEEAITLQHVTRLQIQPARVPFFLSIWWHLQVPDHWPIFYLRVRDALLTKQEQQNLRHDPVEAYFSFRAGFLSLTKELELSPWELEHLLTWQRDQHFQQNKRQVFAYEQKSAPASLWSTEGITHHKPSRKMSRKTEQDRMLQEKQGNHHRTHIQWLLATLGRKVGCQIWVRGADHQQMWQQQPLGTLSLSSLPVPVFQEVIGHIDVLWLLNNQVIAAYAIDESHIDVAANLLRLFDLAVLFPAQQPYLCIVTPKPRFEHVLSELSRPLFQQHHLQQRCSLISQEMLLHSCGKSGRI